jgi:HAD superfamily hydrolase (TIGR01509 family)
MPHRRGVLFDVDGTLVDTNYAHTIAWAQAFRATGHPEIPMAHIHRSIGLGAPKLVERLLGEFDERAKDAHTDYYGPWLHSLRPFDGAGELLHATAELGLVVALASSASEKESVHLRETLGCDDVIEVMTNSGDVEEAKPEPDVVQAALEKSGLDATDAVFVGDTVWDVEAAAKAGVPCVCVLTGGFGEDELRGAGAVAVYRDARDLLDQLDASPIGELAKRA